MRKGPVCTVVMSLMLMSCAESVHQHERMGFGQGSLQMPAEVTDGLMRMGLYVRPMFLPGRCLLGVSKYLKGRRCRCRGLCSRPNGWTA